MDMAKVNALIAALEGSSLGGLEYEEGGFRLALWRPGEGGRASILPGTSATAPQPDCVPGAVDAAAPGPSESAGPDGSALAVSAPLVGTVYRAREPGGQPLVSVGSRVVAGDALCLIEAMKMFNEITAPGPGVVAAIHFEDGAMVEYGAPLMTIEADL